jgi:hypothetical protein
MIGLLCFVLAVLAAPIKSKMRLEAENAVLRHQLTVLRRRLQGRVRLTNKDRRLLIMLYRWFPSILQVLTIIRPETLIHWHRSGFCCYWRWKSRSLGGRPPIEARLRALIRQMSMNNPLWGATRIHGELLKLGFEVAQSSVAKYMVKRRGPSGQGWLTFPRRHFRRRVDAPVAQASTAVTHSYAVGNNVGMRLGQVRVILGGERTTPP